MHRIVYPILSLFVLAGCVAPQPIVKFQPASEPSYWWHGKQMLKQQANKLETVINFEEADKQEVVFSLKITNLGSDTVLISPELFLSKYFADSFNLNLAHRYSKNPETEILNIDKSISRQNAQNANKTLTELSFLAVAVTSDALSSEEGTPNTDQHLDDSHRRRVEAENYLLNTRNQKEFWELDALRKTSLPPNYYLEGLVVFPMVAEAKSVNVILPINGSDCIFSYYIEQIKP